jgi:hypothetical protein
MALRGMRRLRRERRRARLRASTRIYAIGLAAAGSTVAVVGGELLRVWHRGSAPRPYETDDVLGAAEEAARETVEVAVEGYRDAPAREQALVNLLATFTLSFGVVRATAHLIRVRGAVGPFRNVFVADRHIHHFVPGILLLLVSGGASIASRNEDLDRWLAIPFGIGAALTLDESALLLELDDVYWTERGAVSVEIALASLAIVSSLSLVRRILRRGEQLVLVERRVGDRRAAPPGLAAA